MPQKSVASHRVFASLAKQQPRSLHLSHFILIIIFILLRMHFFRRRCALATQTKRSNGRKETKENRWKVFRRSVSSELLLRSNSTINWKTCLFYDCINFSLIFTRSPHPAAPRAMACVHRPVVGRHCNLGRNSCVFIVQSPCWGASCQP